MIRPSSLTGSRGSCDAGAPARVARDELAQIRRLTVQITALERELHALIQRYRPELLAETGCGTLTAAVLIGRTAGAERFPTDASFARHAGIAPIRCSSGQRDRHRLHRGGARGRPWSRGPGARRQAEGKSKREAIRCLKRHLARRFHRILTAPPAPTRPQRVTVTAAPASMVCLT